MLLALHYSEGMHYYVFFLILLACNITFALDAPKIAARRASATTATISWTFSRVTNPTVEIQRSENGSNYKTITNVKRARSGKRFTDKKINSTAFRYRARLVVNRSRSRWSRVANVTSGTSAAPTPTSEPTPRSGNFDGTGNVTAQGKIEFNIPSNLSANIGRGRDRWFGTCRECHSVEKTGRDFVTLKNVLPRSPMFINLSDNTVADLTAYLNRFNQ
jgi:hypothetical protein